MMGRRLVEGFVKTSSVTLCKINPVLDFLDHLANTLRHLLPKSLAATFFNILTIVRQASF